MNIKSKLNKKIKFFLFIFVVLFCVKTEEVFAEVAIDVNKGEFGGVYVNLPGFIGGYVEAWYGDDCGADTYACIMKRSYGTGWYDFKCLSDPRIPNFCSDILSSCQPNWETVEAKNRINYHDDNCTKAIAGVYDKKMKKILQDELDTVIKDTGVDLDVANSAIKTCQGDLVCINATLGVLQQDPANADGANSNNNINDPLTLGSLSDLINSYSNNQPTPDPVNSASNDPIGMQGKMPGPIVDVSFISESSQTGTSMSARAIPGLFSDDSNPKDLYFTWYLKRKDCSLTEKDHPTGMKRNSETLEFEKIEKESDLLKISACDMDGDEIITVNDWKITAARINFAKSFDSNETDVNGNKLTTYLETNPATFNNEAAGYTAYPLINEKNWRNGFLRDSGNDLYVDNKSEDVDNCYIQAPISGLPYELRKVTSNNDDNCEEGTHQACLASNQSVLCNDVQNPLYDIILANQTEDNINAIKAWNADPLNASDPAYPKVVPLPYSISKTIQKQTDKFCVVDNKAPACKIDDIKNYSASIVCDDGKVPACVKDDVDNNAVNNSYFSGIIFGKNNLCSSLSPFLEAGEIVEVPTLLDAYPSIASAGITCDEFIIPDPNTTDFDLDACKAVELDISQRIALNAQNNILSQLREPFPLLSYLTRPNLEPFKNKSCTNILADSADENQNKGLDCTFEKSQNLCKHLFPTFPESKVNINGKEIDMSDEISGDGKFTLKEKEFWGADPAKISTTGSGKDEANVVGLGLDNFKWSYSVGDEIGVVVEGESTLPSDHVDEVSNRRMWAFSNGSCNILEDMEDEATASNSDVEKNTRGFYKEGVKGILTADVDLNNCLPENLLTPESENNSALSVQLNAAPENPVNDSSGGGDVLTVVSSEANSQNSGSILYEWTVQESRDGSTTPNETTSWVDITNKMKTGGSFADLDLSGLGKKSLAINLNIQKPEEAFTNQNSFTGAFWLRIKVKITGGAVDGGQPAQGSILVRVRQKEGEMLIYPVTATSSGMLNLNKENAGNSLERCSSLQGKNTCFVTKNELLGVSIPLTSNSNAVPFNWKINGREMFCAEGTSVECNAGNVLFFPILGNVGEAVDVVANGLDANNESIEIRRHFVIVEPKLKIESMDGSAWPKVLGYYKDLSNDGPCLQGGAGCSADLSTVVMQTGEGTTVTLNANSGTGLEWAIDGIIRPEFRDKNQIQLPITKRVGESFNIGLSTYLLPGSTVARNNIRKALSNNWGITQENAVEEEQSANIQLEVVAGDQDIIASKNSGVFGASLITHLPTQLLFLFKISLTAILMFVATGGLFALIPETLGKKEV